MSGLVTARNWAIYCWVFGSRSVGSLALRQVARSRDLLENRRWRMGKQRFAAFAMPDIRREVCRADRRTVQQLDPWTRTHRSMEKVGLRSGGPDARPGQYRLSGVAVVTGSLDLNFAPYLRTGSGALRGATEVEQSLGQCRQDRIWWESEAPGGRDPRHV